MAFLDKNVSVFVDAVLTELGRQQLASTGNLNISKFALSDDGIDYKLFDITNAQAYEYYLRGKYKFLKREEINDIDISRILLNIPSYELTTSYRLFPKIILDSLNLSQIKSDGYAFFVEIVKIICFCQTSWVYRKKYFFNIKSTVNFYGFIVRLIITL